MDAITDDSNLWLAASRAHDSGEFDSAISLYLTDIKNCLSRNSLSRAALSCSCGADCLLRIGMVEEAKRLYFESAVLSELNSELMIGRSVRESLWSLLQAYDHFLFIADDSRAEMVYHKFVSLSRRTNPIDGESEAINVLRARKHESRLTDAISQATSMTVKTSSDRMAAIRQEIESIIRARTKLDISRSGVDFSLKESFEERSSIHIEGSIVS